MAAAAAEEWVVDRSAAVGMLDPATDAGGWKALAAAAASSIVGRFGMVSFRHLEILSLSVLAVWDSTIPSPANVTRNGCEDAQLVIIR